jgi:tetratricopeptide (TPR) repeat protein
MAFFNSADYRKAKEIFDKVATGPVLEIAHAARTHGAACERRLAAQARPQFKTPEEQYDYAVTLINRRQPAEAVQYLLSALESADGGSDHVHYALAICYGLQGELEKAGDHLRRAIELDPKNRTIARNDPDFDSFMHDPPISTLLQPERIDSE